MISADPDPYSRGSFAISIAKFVWESMGDKHIISTNPHCFPTRQAELITTVIHFARQKGSTTPGYLPPLSLAPTGVSHVATPRKGRKVSGKALLFISAKSGPISRICSVGPSAGIAATGNKRALFTVSNRTASWMDAKWHTRYVSAS